MKHQRLFFWSITAALAGFLFGFDTIVISGAEQQIQSIWSLSNVMHGLCTSAALWGTVVGALCGGWPTERLGRRPTLLAVGVLYFVSAVGSAIAPEVYTFMIARFVGGLGVGVATVAAPLYISEISPARLRGRLAGLFQFNIVFGILIAFLSNWLIGALVEGGIAWRWMLGVEAFPALIYTALCFTLPESPRWLIVHGGKYDAGVDVFRQINPEMPEAELKQAADAVAASVGDRQTAAKFFTSRLKIPIMLAFLVAFFNQLSGINAILYFAPRLLGLAGLTDPLLAASLLGVTNLIFTYVGLWLIDKIGRRTLLFIGSLGYIASLGVCALAFLSFPGFKVVSSAIDVETGVKQMQRIDAPDSPLTEADKQNIRDEFADAKTALMTASTAAGYSGKAVTIPPDASLEQAEQIATAAKKRASEILGVMSTVVLISIMAFIAAHAVGQGTVIWVFISEIFPNRNRAAGQALGSSTHWVFAALITLFFPIAIKAFDAGALFGFFCFMMALQLLWVIFVVPETKNVPLEEMQEKLGIN